MALDGKIVTITGAASGIGLMSAKLFAQAGATVLMSDADGGRLESAVQEVTRVRPDTRGMIADVTKPADLEALVEEARETHGRLDVMMNNAGIAVTGAFDEISDEDATRHITVNLLGVMYGTRAAARLMRGQQSGHIVNVASLAGLSAVPGAAAYCASKWGVRGYTHSCALELRDTPIEFTVICPDAADTPMLDAIIEEGHSPLILSGSTLTAERVARTIVGVVEKPRREIAIPASRGVLAKFGMLFPGKATDGLLSVFEKKGRETIAGRRKTAP
ncbi:MAG: SDR family NAD(P)-dependent oxidoreductase [Myxococcota bacterium]